MGRFGRRSAETGCSIFRFLKRHYEVIRELGRGGMGVVLLARDTKLGRLVALKVLLGTGKAAAKLLAEAQATARAQHANIVVVHDVGQWNEHPYMALEYIEGKTLRQTLVSYRNQGRILPQSLVASVVTAILQALTAAHKCGVVHPKQSHAPLDLRRPSNILLGSPGITNQNRVANGNLGLGPGGVADNVLRLEINCP